MTPLPVDLDLACKILAYANTPYYLFKHLRNERILFQTAAFFPSTDSLLDRLRGDLERPIATPSDLVEIYVLLLSLTFKPPSEYVALLKSLHAEHVQWFEELKAIALAFAVPSRQSSYTVPATKPLVTFTH